MVSPAACHRGGPGLNLATSTYLLRILQYTVINTYNKVIPKGILALYLLIIQLPTDILGWNHLGCCQEPLIKTSIIAYKLPNMIKI